MTNSSLSSEVLNHVSQKFNTFQFQVQGLFFLKNFFGNKTLVKFYLIQFFVWTFPEAAITAALHCKVKTFGEITQIKTEGHVV